MQKTKNINELFEKILKKSTFGPFWALFAQSWANENFSEKFGCQFVAIIDH